MPWCPKCGAEYREGFTECTDCRVPLTETKQETDAAAEAGQEPVLPEGMENPIAIYTAKGQAEADILLEALEDEGVQAAARQAAFQALSRTYGGGSARYGVEIVVGAADTARARSVIERFQHDLDETEIAEDELARLAEEQAMEEPEQPMEDNASFKLMPVMIGVIALALVLLYFINR